MSNAGQCNKCKRYFTTWLTDGSTDPIGNCGGEVHLIDLSSEDFSAIQSVSRDSELIEAMIDLKHKDIIEYNLKIAKFKEHEAEQDKMLKAMIAKPKCPTCSSKNISKISTTGKMLSVGFFGLASGSIGKTMKCNKCGYKW